MRPNRLIAEPFVFRCLPTREVAVCRTELVDVLSHGEADADQQDARCDHQRCHDNDGALHPPVSDLQ